MANQVTKPTKQEQRLINLRLKAKYPQMYEKPAKSKYFPRKGLGERFRSALAKYVTKRRKKVEKYKSKSAPRRASNIEKRLKDAGLTEADIAKLKGE